MFECSPDRLIGRRPARPFQQFVISSLAMLFAAPASASDTSECGNDFVPGERFVFSIDVDDRFADSVLGEQASVFIVATTANAMEEDRERYRATGMDDYVSELLTQRRAGGEPGGRRKVSSA